MPEIVFKGKEYVYNHHLTVPYRPLVVQPGKGVGDGRPGGQPGHPWRQPARAEEPAAALCRPGGPGLHRPALQHRQRGLVLQRQRQLPIMKEWLSTNPVDGDDLLRHDKWLCMMWPRLVLLRELLSERGSIWITLDDNEVHRARMVLDEIFGEQAFVVTCVWQRKQSPRRTTPSHFSAMTMTMFLSYAKRVKLSADDANGWQRRLDSAGPGAGRPLHEP
jgi:adenine-specific DNA-methyltransferase